MKRFAFDKNPAKGVRLESGVFKISGWCFSPLGEAPHALTVERDGLTIAGEISSRPDVVSSIDEVAIPSDRIGFNASTHLFKRGKSKLRVTAHYTSSEDEIIFLGSVRVTGKALKPEETHSSDCIFSFDKNPAKGIKLKNGVATLSGWCFDKDGTPPKEVIVQCDGQEVEASLYKRSDIKDAFPDINFSSDKLGFHLATHLFKPGRRSIKITAIFQGTRSTRIFEKETKITGRQAHRSEQADGSSGRFHIDEPSASEKAVVGAGPFRIRGWFVDQNEKPARRIIGRMGSRILLADVEPRPDLVAPLGLKDSKSRFGFCFDFKTRPGPKLLKIEAETAEGTIIPLHTQLLFNTVWNFKKNSYERWIKNRDTFYSKDKKADQKLAQSLRAGPKFSILLPTYNSDLTFLKKAVDSVKNQIYTNWELCIADDASTCAETIAYLKTLHGKNPKIKVTFRKDNGHISAASNSALALATGNWVGLLDHDDVLSPRALLKCAEAIDGNKALKFIYTDEDKVDQRDRRKDPHFKPDWNPDMLYGINYICHFTVVEKDLVQQVGGFRIGLEGAQDHDLFLRTTGELTPDEIHHIPEILYSWRMLPGSTAEAASEKSYTHQAGVRALKDFFGNTVEGVYDGKAPNTYRVKFKLPSPEPLVSILIPMRDNVAFTKMCIDSIFDKTTYQNYEILILDNGSVEDATHSYFDTLKEESRVKILSYDQPFNYSAINNFGASKASGEVLILLNNDIEVLTPDWLEEMVSHAMRPEIGCVGAKLYYPDDTIQHAGVILGIGGVAGHSHKYFQRGDYGYHSRLIVNQNYSAVTAACLAIRKSVFGSVDGLDENLAVAFNDVDFCIRVFDLGLNNIWLQSVEHYHHESKSRGAENSPEKVERFRSEIKYFVTQHRNLRDDFYNPHLSLANERFEVQVSPKDSISIYK